MAGNCSRPAALTSISKVDCAINLGQFAAILFQRKQADAPFATEAAMKLLANWTAFLGADDSTKVVKTPEFVGFKIPGTEAVYVGENSNDSLDGQGVFVGYNAAKATGNFQSVPFDIIAQLKDFEGESAPALTDGLTGYLVTSDRRILAVKQGTGLGGIPMTNFNVADRNLDGFRTLDGNAFGFTLAPGWSKDLVVITPSFDPRALLNA